MSAELLGRLIRLVQAMHCKVSELLGLVVDPIKGVLDRNAIELGVEPFAHARHANIDASCEVFGLEPQVIELGLH